MVSTTKGWVELISIHGLHLVLTSHQMFEMIRSFEKRKIKIKSLST